MGQPAAKQGDRILATDLHTVMVPSGGGPVPTPMMLPFTGIIDDGLSPNVLIMGRPAATTGSTATNTPEHEKVIPPGTWFQKPPSDQGVITRGSSSVLINGKPAARTGDPAQTCGDPTPNMAGQVVAVGTVLIGG